MRADRLLTLVLLLQNHRRLTARALAERLEVSERTIHRDMEALSGAGIPVVAERGFGGGWSLLGEYRTNLTGLNEAEIKSLFVSKPTRLLADLNLAKASEGALLKLLAALPSVYRKGAEFARQRVYVDVTGWHAKTEAVPLLHVLQDAIWRDCKVCIRYQRGEFDSVQRVLEPLGLVAKGSVWYLVARIDRDLRSYRVSRIIEAELTNVQFVRPADFDLKECWNLLTLRFQEHLPNYKVLVRVRPEIVARMPYGGRFARVEHVGQTDDEGWVYVSLRFDVEQMACEYALGFGCQLEVLEPAVLREKVLDAAKATVNFYGASDE